MTHFKDVETFMTTFEQEVHTKFNTPNTDDVKLRLELILEEFIELYVATVKVQSPTSVMATTFLQGASRAISELTDEDIELDHMEIADALTDIEYVTLGAGHTFGVNLDKTFDEVQSSNMSKLGSDGKPIFREDGKVLKGPDYKKPDIAKVLLEAGCYS